MSESPQSTSDKSPIQTLEKSPIENLGLQHSITGSNPVSPNSMAVAETQHTDSAPAAEDDSPPWEVAAAAVVEESAAAVDEDAELRNAIERDLCRLTIEQAEIETARGILEMLAVGEAKGKEVDGLGEEKDGNDFDDEKGWKGVNDVDGENGWNWKGGDDVEYGNGHEGGSYDNGGNVGSGLAAMKLGRYNNQNQNNSGCLVNYPRRPDAEDCSFYMKFGSCKFGVNCKFNHPPRRKGQGVKERSSHRDESSERTGQTECKYYLTSGGCKYGMDCKYSHGSDKSSKSHITEFNFLGLPIRAGEKECPYYMRTGSCKYGSNCRFHHPEPTTVGGADTPSGYGNGISHPSQFVPPPPVPSWSSPRASSESTPFTPMYPSTQGASASNSEWNGYQAANYPTSERSLPVPPAFAITNLPNEINFPLPHQHDMVLQEYPERPGEPECSFFMKTGDCKFKSNCKFHHPKNRIPKARANTCVLSDKGLPLRPDQPICTFYHRYGICKYGPSCKYDHPSNFAILSSTYDHPPFGNPNIINGAVEFGKGSES